MNEQIVNRISGFVVLGLSLFAMSLVVGATILASLGRLNPSPDGDEGTLAHLFQLAIVLVLPAGLTFLATANWERPSGVVKRLVTLYYMEHMR